MLDVASHPPNDCHQGNPQLSGYSIHEHLANSNLCVKFLDSWYKLFTEYFLDDNNNQITIVQVIKIDVKSRVVVLYIGMSNWTSRSNPIETRLSLKFLLAVSNYPFFLWVNSY